ncbi:MAG TPA: hypothetical protein VIK26_06560, partial [Clostridium sp.]
VIIGNNCTLGINNIITDSIIWDEITIKNNSTVSNIILSDNFKISKRKINIKTIEPEVLSENIMV